ncbi:MAG: PAM68 family protein [Cyanobacteria bacterium J06635_15]
MASEDSKRDRLPFEPSSNRKKSEKQAGPVQSSDQASKTATSASSGQQRTGKWTKPSKSPAKAEKRAVQGRASREDTSIPEVVNRRMLKRIAFFSGMPTILGVFIFFASYVLLTQGVLEFPKVVVLMSTLLCFGLGVVGLSYGALSASWDEEISGSTLGWSEFRLNFGRMTSAWRSARESSSKSDN